MGPRRILVVEDERITAMDLEERLHRLGYTVSATASAADEAIRKAGETQPDLVLMDIVLDNQTDGVQAAQEVQAHFGIPVVFLTAYSDDATWDRVKATEPFGYLVKPVNDRDLQVGIELALRRREAEKRETDIEQLLGQFADCSDIGMMTFDHWGVLTSMNATAAESLGFRLQETIGKHVTEVFALDGRHRAFSSMVRAVGTSLEANVAHGAWGVERAEGEPEVQHRVIPIADKEGNIAGTILCFQPTNGVEPNLITQEELVNSCRAILQGDESADAGLEKEAPLQVMNALMHKSPLATIILDPAGGILACNSAFENLFLYGENEIRGTQLGELIIVKGTEPDSFEAGQTVFSGQALHTTDIRRRKDNTIVVVEIYSVPLLLRGQLKAIHISYMDFTKRSWEVGMLHEQATTDALTGLANLHWFNRVLQEEIQRSKRTGREFAILMFDVDDLKKVNDHYGHTVGNKSLCRLAEVLRTNCRVLDTAARWGGDEFVLILPETNEDAAWQVARRISNQLSVGQERPPLTVSVGVAVFPEDGRTSEKLMETADRVLYETKRRRGNKFVN